MMKSQFFFIFSDLNWANKAKNESAINSQPANSSLKASTVTFLGGLVACAFLTAAAIAAAASSVAWRSCGGQQFVLRHSSAPGQPQLPAQLDSGSLGVLANNGVRCLASGLRVLDCDISRRFMLKGIM